MKCYKF